MSGCTTADFTDGDEDTQCDTGNPGAVCSTNVTSGDPPTANGMCADSSCEISLIRLNCGTNCNNTDLTDANLYNSCDSSSGDSCDSDVAATGFVQDGICAASTCDNSGHTAQNCSYGESCTGTEFFTGCGDAAISNNDRCDGTLTSGDFSGEGICSSGSCVSCTANENSACGDGIDNDCDGAIDGGDIECGAPLNVTINFPANTSYTLNDLPLNFNVSLSANGSLVQFSLNNGVNNVTMSSVDNRSYNATNSSIGDGSYVFQVYANDTFGNRNDSESIAFSFDTTPPLVTINFPANTTYDNSDLPLNFNVSLNEQGSVRYSLNNGANNVTMLNTTGGTLGTLFNHTNTSIADGSYTFRVYANDTEGNNNWTENVTFSLDTTDNIYPNFANFVELPSNGTVYVSLANYSFNSTITQTNGTVGLEFNGINYTASNLSNVFNASVNDLSAGVFSYYWWAFGNGSKNNYNTTNIKYYSVNKTLGNISLLLNSTAANQTAVFGTPTNASASTLFGQWTIYRNGINVNSENNTFVTLGVGDWNYTAVSNGDQNHSEASITRWTHITLSTSEVNLTLNGTEKNISILQSSILLNGTLITGDTGAILRLFNNGTLINENSREVSNLTAFSQTGLFNITIIYNQSQNYSQSSEIYWVNVSVDNVQPNVVINLPQNKTYGFNNLPLNFNVSLNEQGSVRYSLNNGVNNVTMLNTTGGTIGTLFNHTNTSIADGGYTFRVYANDTEGNNNWTENVTFAVDQTFPLISFGNGTENDAVVVQRNWIYVNVSITETNENTVTFRLHNSTSEFNVSIRGAGNRTINWTSIPDGVYTYNVSVNDSGNNVNTTATRTITLDSSSPTINFTNPTPANGFSQTNGNIFVNVSSFDVSQHYTFADFDSSLSLWMRMDDVNSSGNPTDLSSYSNNGTISINASINSTGKFGNASHFKGLGTNSSILIGNSGHFSNICSNGCSFSAWINRKTSGILSSVIARYDESDDNRFFFLYASASDRPIFSITENGNSTTCDAIPGSSTINTNTWYHLVGVYNTTATLIYQDSVLQDSTTCSFSSINTTAWSDSESTFIGVYDDSSFSGTFEGAIDEVIIFNRSLTANEVSSLFNASTTQYSNNFTGLGDKTHSFIAYSADISGRKNQTEERQVTTSSFPPSVTINFPANRSYGSANLPLNFNVSLSKQGSVRYSLNNGVNNITMSNTTGGTLGTLFNHTNTSIADGGYTFRVYANDTEGNNNWTENVTFAVAQTFPLISFGNGTENDAIVVQRNWIYVNVSITETNENTVTFRLHNSTSEFNVSIRGAGNRTINWTNIQDGVYTYNVSVNDSGNNVNTTATRTITLDSSSPTINFTNPTPANGFSQTNGNIFVNVSSFDVSQHYTFADFDSSLSLWMRMDDYIGGKVIDLSSYSRNSSISGNVVLNSTGKFGNASHLDGEGDYITLGTGNNFSDICKSGCSFSSWINKRDDSKSGVVLSRYDTTGDNRFFLFYVTDAELPTFVIGENGNTTDCIAQPGSATISTNTWYHLTGVYNTTATLIYQDGIQQDFTTCSFTSINATAWSDNESTFMGVNDDGALLNGWNGSIDEVLIFNRTLSSQEILSLFNASTTQFSKNFTGLNDGPHNFVAHSVDIFGRKNSTSTRQGSVSSVPPQVTINFPVNGETYSSVDYPLNFNVSLNEEGSVQYSLDNGINNITMFNATGGTLGTLFNHRNTSIADGNYTFRVYANDTEGNNNWTENVTFAVDQTFPL